MQVCKNTISWFPYSPLPGLEKGVNGWMWDDGAGLAWTNWHQAGDSSWSGGTQPSGQQGADCAVMLKATLTGRDMTFRSVCVYSV